MGFVWIIGTLSVCVIGPVYDGFDVLCVVWVYCLGSLEISSVAALGISVIGPHVMSNSPLMVDVACFSCVDMYNKNVGICNAVCFEWMLGNLCVV